ncbi:group III truncated hemoglobin [Sulfurirhabdus autotrophica]|uniref:group III truncated hemoglobin n=1 Tax=Sulfurirhabdus autotrophica TaxID=1706046 RepID=UPI000F613390|nr:group III truncated hemoglobin [Sulfurirhabdus autotrophica]
MATGISSPRKLEPLCDKIGRKNVEVVIHAFYDKLQTNHELATFFNRITNISAHKAHASDFWWIAMGGKTDNHCTFDMIGRHKPLGLSHDSLSLWLALFHETLLQHLPQELAEKWCQMAQGIGKNLFHNIV